VDGEVDEDVRVGVEQGWQSEWKRDHRLSMVDSGSIGN
jgi:hypothetical protein